jgi:hypothetical protein
MTKMNLSYKKYAEGGCIQDGRQLREAEILSSMISEKYFRVMVVRLG